MNLSLNEFVSMLVLGSFALVAGASLGSRFLHLRAEKRLVRRRTVCRLCGNRFISDQSGITNHCPSCDKPNLRRGNGRLG
jgi:hypothetical protein